MLRRKKEQIEALEKRYKTGIERLDYANEQMNYLQEELVLLQPQLVQTSLETTCAVFICALDYNRAVHLQSYYEHNRA